MHADPTRGHNCVSLEFVALDTDTSVYAKGQARFINYPFKVHR